MRYIEVIERLTEIEAKLDVNSFWIDGVQVWPIVRMQLWPFLLSSEISIADGSSLAAIASPIQGQGGRVSQWPRFRSLFDRPKLNAKAADILCFSRIIDHTENFSTGKIDRIIDPVVWLARRNGFSVSKISATPNNATNIGHQLEPSLFFDIDHFFRQANHKEPQGILTPLLEEIEKYLGPTPVNHSTIVSAVRAINDRARLFRVILKKISPKVVFLGVFYSAEATALTFACRRLGIPVVDVQHGKQGLYEPMYGYWSVIPENGYSILPDYFWQWGGASVRQTASTLPEKTNRPAPIVGGNLWMGAWRQSKSGRLSPEPARLFSRLKTAKKRILITLQTFENPLLESWRDAMARAPADWLWLVRLHPHRRAVDSPAIISILNVLGVSSYDIDDASAAPLYPLLAECDLLVTAFSSVAYEAHAFGIPAVVMHANARELYAADLQEGIFHFAETADELLALAEAAPDLPRIRSKEPYIEVDKHLADEALAQILNNGSRKSRQHHRPRNSESRPKSDSRPPA